VISDYLSGLWLKYAVTVYTCEACGRFKVQESTQSQLFRSFAPEDSSPTKVLQSEHQATASDER
jgi:hypothetical protein